jgi:fermentation-respiration switch protein FrsA (DUF1100 family)
MHFTSHTLAGYPYDESGASSLWVGRVRQSPNLSVRLRWLLGMLGLGGLVFGGLPLWAARRIIYPASHKPRLEFPTQHLNMRITIVPERVTFPARDGKQIGGWFVPGRDPHAAPWPCILLVYGYGSCKEEMAGYAQMLHEGGFASLMFDMRGSGLRRGEPVTLGYKERWDVMDAVRYLLTRADVDPERIGALGVSMGGATALLAAAEEPRIRALVTDSAYANLTDMIKPGIRAFIGPFAMPLAPLIVRYAETLLGVRADEVRPDQAAARLGDRPMLVIHGADDGLTDPASANRIYEAASGPVELWVVPGCQHACAPVAAADEYKRRINDFFSRWLAPGPSGRGESRSQSPQSPQPLPTDPRS